MSYTTSERDHHHEVRGCLADSSGMASTPIHPDGIRHYDQIKETAQDRREWSLWTDDPRRGFSCLGLKVDVVRP